MTRFTKQALIAAMAKIENLEFQLEQAQETIEYEIRNAAYEAEQSTLARESAAAAWMRVRQLEEMIECIRR